MRGARRVTRATDKTKNPNPFTKNIEGEGDLKVPIEEVEITEGARGETEEGGSTKIGRLVSKNISASRFRK